MYCRIHQWLNWYCRVVFFQSKRGHTNKKWWEARKNPFLLNCNNNMHIYKYEEAKERKQVWQNVVFGESRQRILNSMWYFFLKVSMHAYSVTQSCLDLCNHKDSSLPGPSVHGTFQARILAWVAISSSRGSSWSRDWTHISCSSWIHRKILWQWHPTAGLLPGKSHGRRSLVGYSPWGREESDTTDVT